MTASCVERIPSVDRSCPPKARLGRKGRGGEGRAGYAGDVANPLVLLEAGGVEGDGELEGPRVAPLVLIPVLQKVRSLTLPHPLFPASRGHVPRRRGEGRPKCRTRPYPPFPPLSYLLVVGYITSNKSSLPHSPSHACYLTPEPSAFQSRTSHTPASNLPSLYSP